MENLFSVKSLKTQNLYCSFIYLHWIPNQNFLATMSQWHWPMTISKEIEFHYEKKAEHYLPEISLNPPIVCLVLSMGEGSHCVTFEATESTLGLTYVIRYVWIPTNPNAILKILKKFCLEKIEFRVLKQLYLLYLILNRSFYYYIIFWLII